MGLDVSSLHMDGGYKLYWDLITNFKTITLR